MIIQRSIRKALQNPETVTGLDLRQVKPTTLFPEIVRFINLEFIDLSNCPSLDWADACIKLSKLPKLTEIKAFGAGIKTLPAEFGLLTALKKIDFSGNNELASLPESFSALTELEDISFYGCGLTTLPSAVWHFPNLLTLTLGRNKLQTIPATFFDGMAALQNLFIHENQLTSLPENMSSLSNLRLLYSGGNPLSALPEKMDNLVNLETLWLDSCQGLDLEKELGKIQHLPIKNLSVLGNNIAVLPAAFSALNKLEVLNINSNKLNDTRGLIKDLAQLPLKILDIRFMGTENISLEQAQEIIPGLQEILCDTRTTEEFSKDINSWLVRELSPANG